jgi:hypothetical protein
VFGEAADFKPAWAQLILVVEFSVNYGSNIFFGSKINRGFAFDLKVLYSF